MTEAADHGISVTEIAAGDQSIAVMQETTAAFVGRTLRGPLNTPVLLRNFGDFRRRFGGIWSHSSLGPAVQQFFDHGGQRLYVVRVANNARGAMVCLPANGSAVVLRAAEPGSTEHLRAAVDYDAIDDDALFNLTLQRVDPQSGLVTDQELFRRLHYAQGAEDFIGDVLLNSTLARLEHPYPVRRPELTGANGEAFEVDYVDPAQAGTDGTELTDYDLIGSRKAKSGLFALEELERFDALYLPPLGRDDDVGPAAILAAELYCRQRGAMLIVDPRATWSTAAEAVAGIRDLGYASPNMLGYFPRVIDRAARDATPRHAGGALAGLLCKHDRTCGAWRELNQQVTSLRRSLQPAVVTGDEDSRALQRAGLNVLMRGPAGRARIAGSVTLARGAEVHREYNSLAVRRFTLQIVNAIARATRWAVFEANTEQAAEHLCAQVMTYFSQLDEFGAFVDSRFSVHCEAARRRQQNEPNSVTLLLQLHPVGSVLPLSLTLHLSPLGCRVGSTAFAPAMESTGPSAADARNGPARASETEADTDDLT